MKPCVGASSPVSPAAPARSAADPGSPTVPRGAGQQGQPWPSAAVAQHRRHQEHKEDPATGPGEAGGGGWIHAQLGLRLTAAQHQGEAGQGGAGLPAQAR